MPNKALSKLVSPDAKLARIIGASSIPRSQILKKLWNHIRTCGGQDGRNIILSTAMKQSGIWGSKSKILMTELGKALKHAK